MRIFSVSLVVLLFACGSVSSLAQKPKPADKQVAPAKPSWTPYMAIQQFKIIAAIDADLDGTMTAKEIEGAVERIKKLDTDGDGKLVAEEFLKAPPVASMVSGFGVVKALDVDKNGELSAEEIEGAVVALRKADKNTDGKLESVEYAMQSPMSMGGGGGGGGGAMPTPEEFIKQNDKNGDGKVAKSELTGTIVGFFDGMDADKDGFVTVEEVKASRARRQNAGGGRGGGRRGGATPAASGPGGNAAGEKKSNAPKTDAPKTDAPK